MFANRISSSTSCSIWPPETSPPSSSRDVLRHRFQSCNTFVQMNPTDGTWIGDWAWSLPLIMLNVVIHVCGLALIGERVVRVLNQAVDRRNFIPKFAVVMGATSLLVTILHGIEGGIWAAAYRFLGALTDS